jgi:hypothetical protein
MVYFISKDITISLHKWIVPLTNVQVYHQNEQNHFSL